MNLRDLAKDDIFPVPKYIFFAELVSPKVAQTIAQETGATTAVLNPLEGLTESDLKAGKDYFSIMRDNLQILKKALP